jgi:hypothetical protein
MWWKKIQSMDSKFTHLSISKVNNIPIKPHEENPCFSWGKQNPCFSLQRVCEGDAGLTISLRAWCPWIVPSSNHDFMDELYSMKVCPHWLTKLHPLNIHKWYFMHVYQWNLDDLVAKNKNCKWTTLHGWNKTIDNIFCMNFISS